MNRHVVIPDASMDDDASFSSGGMYSSNNRHQAFPPRATTFTTPGAGASVSSDPEVVSVKRDREREGRCGDCGVQTHEFHMDPQTGQPAKVALTVENEVHRGRCLFCHPLPKPGQQHLQGLGNIVFSSSRSINTVSSHGNNSVQSANGLPPLHHTNARMPPHMMAIYPDTVESRSVASTVTTSVVDETLQALEEESTDLLDVLTAMKRFPDEKQVQARGLEKLWIQSYDEENSLAIGRIGGIPTIVHAMTAFADHSSLQQCGCEALQNLADNDYNRDVIVEQGGIVAIVNAMNQHVEVVGVQQCGCTALGNLAASPEHHLEIANAGGIHAIINAAQRFRDEESVLRAAYQSLRSLGYDPNRHGNNAGGAGQEHSQGAEQQQPPAGQDRQQQQGEDQEEQNMENAVVLDQHGFPINQ